MNDFSKTIDDYILNWQKDVLRKEMNIFIGLASYKIMKKIGRNVISESEIMGELLKNPFVRQYLNIIETKPTPEKIESGLLHCNLACCTRARVNNERMFEMIDCAEFKQRIERFLVKVDEIN